MSSYLIKDTTVAERIELIKSWQEPEDCAGESGMDLFDMYDEYIKGTKEISQINAEFQAVYIKADPDEVEEDNLINAAEDSDKNTSIADEIRKLKELLDEGILTKEEFAASKKKLLS